MDGLSVETARALNDLARHTAIVRLYQDILMDMQVCEIEGWDKTEFPKMIKEAVNFAATIRKEVDNI